jgi:hypothetical protein
MALGCALCPYGFKLLILLTALLNLVWASARDGHKGHQEQAVLQDSAIQRPLEADHVFVCISQGFE